MVCSFKLAVNVVRGGIWQFVNDTLQTSKLEGDLMGLCVNGNWQIWVRCCGGETVSVHTVGKGTVGFSDVKNITLCTNGGCWLKILGVYFFN